MPDICKFCTGYPVQGRALCPATQAVTATPERWPRANLAVTSRGNRCGWQCPIGACRQVLIPCMQCSSGIRSVKRPHSVAQ